MNRTSFSLASACSLALATSLLAPVAHADGGGNFTNRSFMISLTNPCNGASIQGSVTASAQVQVFGGDYAVAVESTFSGTVTDTSGKQQYRLFGQAVAAYSTLSTHYVLPMLLDVDGINGAQSLSFTQLQDTNLAVNSQQSPLSIGGTGVASTCK
jgi:hypothetical protein